MPQSARRTSFYFGEPEAEGQIQIALLETEGQIPISLLETEGQIPVSTMDKFPLLGT